MHSINEIRNETFELMKSKLAFASDASETILTKWFQGDIGALDNSLNTRDSLLNEKNQELLALQQEVYDLKHAKTAIEHFENATETLIDFDTDKLSIRVSAGPSIIYTLARGKRIRKTYWGYAAPVVIENPHHKITGAFTVLDNQGFFGHTNLSRYAKTFPATKGKLAVFETLKSFGVNIDLAELHKSAASTSESYQTL